MCLRNQPTEKDIPDDPEAVELETASGRRATPGHRTHITISQGYEQPGMYETILVPTDGSTGNVDAFEHAARLAGEDSVVHTLYGVDQRRYRAADNDTTDEVRKSLELEGDRALDDARTRLEELGVAVETVRRDGIPHREIGDYVDEAGVDVVVMGTHGRTGRDRVAHLGSVTQRVVESATVPTLVVDIGD
jgi:nucleotide-binding universal stress UspA family protein